MSAAGRVPKVIEGRVRGPDGAPVEGARVMIVRAPEAFPDIAALTLADGRFSLPAAGVGEHEILVVADGYGEVRRIVVPRASAEPVEVVLEPRS